MPTLKDTEQKLNQTIAHFEDELKKIRTGTAHVGMVEDVVAQVYGVPTPLSHIASISTPDARTILIKPWDKSNLPAIEQAIQRSNLGLAPASDGEQVRLSIPQLTEERRKEIAKLAGKKMEEARIAVRQTRDELWRGIQQDEKDKKISETDKFQQKEKMEKLVEEINKKIAALAEKKEQEILKV